jgi:RNA polymerase sigma factor (sigma-70 family)
MTTKSFVHSGHAASFDLSRFEELYHNCRRIAYKAFETVPPDDVEDAVQTAMIKVWESLQEHPENTFQWFVNRAIGYARNYLRSRHWRHDNRRATLDVVEEAEETQKRHIASVSEKGYEEIEAETLLDGLPTQTKHIVKMLAAGYSQEAVADAFNTTRWHITQRLNEARAFLRPDPAQAQQLSLPL